MGCRCHCCWSPCEHPHLFALNPFFAIAIAIAFTKWVTHFTDVAIVAALLCEHSHCILGNPFIVKDAIAIVVTQCERTLTTQRINGNASVAASIAASIGIL